MQFNRNKSIRIFLVLLLQCASFLSAFATKEPVQTFPLLGSKDSVKVNYISTVTDYQNLLRLSNPGMLPMIQPNTTHITNMVSVGIEEGNATYIQTDFAATIVLHIKKYDQALTLFDEFDSTFTIDYKKAAGATYNALQYFSFENTYKVEVKIVSITPNVTSWDVSKVLRVDNTMETTRDYVFDCSKAVTNLTLAPDNVNGELTVAWTDPANGQTEYDLEWAWIDESAITDYQTNGQFVQEKIFTNNATRVTITSVTYNIPLLYDGEGRLFVRVRPAQIITSGQRVEGKWSADVLNSQPVFYSYSGHQDNLNWQASTSYAEEGKRKSVVQYFDGTLRNRQTVTKDNTTGTTVVAESFYDYQGRPVIQVLPAPTINTIIQYAQNFNKAVNDAGYPKWAYDKLATGATVCDNPAKPLSTSAGTAKYYSPNNELNGTNAGYNPNKYIPNSEGNIIGEAYPFTETRFTPDGRIGSQGGVGSTYQLGSGHETKYFYESPAQEELDALFGTDAGVASHYFKNLVRDANGQYSVSYTDMHGRTVATALAGGTPQTSNNTDLLDPLPSLNTKTFTKQLLDDETNRVIGNSIISSKPIIVPKQGSYQFDYKLDPEQLQLAACTNGVICYDCLYNLKIVVNADCNGLTGFPYTVMDSNFTVGGLLTAPTCNNGKTQGVFSKLFSVVLPEGAYTVIKTLSLSDSARNVYRDVFLKNDTCKKFTDFYDEAYQVLVSQSNCAITCSACDAAIGHDLPGFRANFVTQTGLQEPLSDSLVAAVTVAYNDARAHCDRICNIIDDDGLEAIRSIKKIMLLDVSPPAGQYANPDNTGNYNIFNNYAWAEVFPTGKPAYLYPINYTWNSGAPSGYTFINSLGQPSYPDYSVNGVAPEVFNDQFESAWAEQLLPHHPEYCKLKTTMEQLPATYHFEADLNKLNTWAGVVAATPVPGQYITTILSKDPFFTGPGNAYYAAMLDKITNYIPMDAGHATLWQVAQAMVFCRNEDNTGGTNSDQSSCVRSMPATPSVNPATGCANDWDMVWKNFRSIYLNERKNFISQYLNAQCSNVTNAQLLQQGNSPRFIDFNSNTEINGFGDQDNGSFFDQLGNGDPAADATGHKLLADQYDSTCRGYANYWMFQLSQCDILDTRWQNQATKSADSIWLIDRLRDVCKNGSDEDHPLGSSSIDPSKQGATTYGFSDFPGVIKTFFQNNGITPPLTPLCNPYLINTPKPYGNQPPLTDYVVITKPSDCECTAITGLMNEYNGAGYTGSFSSYLATRYQASITQGAIDTLLNLCNGTYQCIFLPAPIALPALMQCRKNGSGLQPNTSACINCTQFQLLKDSFQVIFNHTPLIKNPQTAADTSWNLAFEKYANSKMGFGKNWNDYASFADSCAKGSIGSGNCDSLQSLIKNYSQTVRRGKVIHTLQTQEGYNLTDLTKLIVNGALQFPDSVRQLPNSWYNNYQLTVANGDRFCTSNGYTQEIRFKFLQNTKTGDVFYSALGIGFTAQRYYGGALNGLTIIDGSGARYYLDPDPNCLLNWMTFKVTVLPSMTYLYYNGNLVFQKARDPNIAIGTLSYFGMGAADQER